jgi:hypothetical protein
MEASSSMWPTQPRKALYLTQWDVSDPRLCLPGRLVNLVERLNRK